MQGKPSRCEKPRAMFGLLPPSKELAKEVTDLSSPPLPAVPAGTATAVTVPGVFQGASHRTNIGAVNTSGSTVILSVEVFSSDGQLVAGTQWTLGAYEHVQVPVTSLGVGNASGGYVTFTRISSAGSFRAYASVVDQESGDSVYTPGT